MQSCRPTRTTQIATLACELRDQALACELRDQADFDEAESVFGAGSYPRELMREAADTIDTLSTQLAAQQGKPSEYPPELKTEGEHKDYCFDWWKALEVHRRSNTTDATLHKIIAGVEAALDAAGAPAGTLVERIGALGEDAARWRFSVADGGKR